MKDFRIAFGALTLLLLIGSPLMAQFNTVVPMLPTKNAMVIAKDGRVVEGKVVGSLIMGGALKSLKIKDENGDKHKFKASEVQEVRAQMTGLAKLAAASEAHSTNGGKIKQIKSIVNASKDDIWKKDLVIFYQVEIKPGKFSLLQLLNPGTNSVISVYPLANPQDSNSWNYLAIKNGEVFKVTKSKYKKKVYPLLFAGCEEYSSKYPTPKKIKMANFATHVTNYNASCSK